MPELDDAFDLLRRTYVESPAPPAPAEPRLARRVDPFAPPERETINQGMLGYLERGFNAISDFLPGAPSTGVAPSQQSTPDELNRRLAREQMEQELGLGAPALQQTEEDRARRRAREEELFRERQAATQAAAAQREEDRGRQTTPEEITALDRAFSTIGRGIDIDEEHDRRDSSLLRERVQHFLANPPNRAMEFFGGAGPRGERIPSAIPVIGGIHSNDDAVVLFDAARRIAARNASPEDFDLVAAHLAQQERIGNRGWLERRGMDVMQLPGYMVEMWLTGGAFTGGRAAASRLATRLLGEGAERFAPRAAAYGAGIAGQMAANPQYMAGLAAQAGTQINVNDEGRISIEDRGGLAENLPMGMLDTSIRFGSERAGAALPYIGTWIAKFPGMGALGQRIAGSSVGRFVSATDASIGGLASRVGYQGYHGILGEAFEERVSDVLRGAAGLQRDHQGRRDFGMVQSFATGQWGRGGQQLLDEAVVFAAIPGAYGGLSVTNRFVNTGRFLPGQGPALEPLPLRPENADERAQWAQESHDIATRNADAVLNWARTALEADFNAWAWENNYPNSPNATAEDWIDAARKQGQLGIWGLMLYEARHPQAEQPAQETPQQQAPAEAQPEQPAEQPAQQPTQQPAQQPEAPDLLGMYERLNDLRAKGPDALNELVAAYREIHAEIRKLPNLTQSQRNVLGHLFNGLTLEQIAEASNVTTQDIQKVFNNLLAKIPENLRNRLAPQTPSAAAQATVDAPITPEQAAQGPAVEPMPSTERRTERVLTEKQLQRRARLQALMESDQIPTRDQVRAAAEFSNKEADTFYDVVLERRTLQAIADERGVSKNAISKQWLNAYDKIGMDEAEADAMLARAEVESKIAAKENQAEKTGGVKPSMAREGATADPETKARKVDPLTRIEEELSRLTDKIEKELARGKSDKLTELLAEYERIEETRRALEQGERKPKKGAARKTKKVASKYEKDSPLASLRGLLDRVKDSLREIRMDRLKAIIAPAASTIPAESFHQGPAPGVTTAQGKGVGAAEWIETANVLFKAPAIVGRGEKYLNHVGLIVTSSGQATNVVIRAHEIGHFIIDQTGLDMDPAAIEKLAGKEVVKGFQEFDYAKNRPLSWDSMSEGFSEWWRRRLTSTLGAGLSTDQQATAEFAERWITNNGYLAPANQLTDLWLNRAGAASMISPEAKPTDPVGLTPTQVAAMNLEKARKRAEEMFLNKFASLVRLTTESNARRGRRGQSPIELGKDPRTVWVSAIQMNREMVRRMAEHGMQYQTKNAQGEWITGTMPDAQPLIWAFQGLGFQDADFQPIGTGVLANLMRRVGIPVKQEASPLDAYITAFYVDAEVTRGLAMLEQGKLFEQSTDPKIKALAPKMIADGTRLVNTVADHQLIELRALLARERAARPKWAENAEEASRRLTHLLDQNLEALRLVGWYSQKDVDAMRHQYPDYHPLLRLVDAEEFLANPEANRQGSGRQIVGIFAAIQHLYERTAAIYAKQLQHDAIYESGRNPEGPAGVGGFFVETDTEPIERRTDMREKLTAMGIIGQQQDDLIDLMGEELVDYITKPAWKPGQKNPYVARRDGKRVSLDIHDRSLYELINDIQVENSTTANLGRMVSKIWGLAQISRLVTFGGTTLSPTFPARNPVRDTWTYFYNVEGNPLVNLMKLLHGHKNAFSVAAQTLVGKELTVYDRLYEDFAGMSLQEFSFGTIGKSEGFRKVMGTSRAKEFTVKAITKVRDFLQLVGAAEHGPRRAEFYRFLEEAGYTRAKVDAAMEADPAATPVPLHVLFAARMKAAKATIDFEEKGYVTEQWNKTIPFLSSHMAGMNQEFRNWRKSPMRMLAGLAMFLGFELLHWWITKDDEWYNQLPAHLRYHWWILGKTADGGTWGIPKPHGLLRMIGGFFTELLRQSSDRNPRWGMATANAVDTATPRVMPVVAGEVMAVGVPGIPTTGIGSNRDWRGMPIIPRRDEHDMTRWEQFHRHQLPYVLEQLTGNLSRHLNMLTGQVAGDVLGWERRTGSPLVNPFQSSRSEPDLVVTDYYDALEEVTRERRRAQGGVFARQREYDILHGIERQMQDLNRRMRGDRMVNGRVVSGARPDETTLRSLRAQRRELALRVMRQLRR